MRVKYYPRTHLVVIRKEFRSNGARLTTTFKVPEHVYYWKEYIRSILQREHYQVSGSWAPVNDYFEAKVKAV